MKLDSAILMNVVLLFLLSTMGGTLWFLLPTRESMDQARLAQAGTALPTPGARARDKQPDVDLAAHWRVELARADREMHSLRQQQEQLRIGLAALTPISGSEAPPVPSGSQDSHELAARLAIRRAELEQLQLTADVEPLGADATMVTGGRAATQGREPVWLQLYASRVLPVDERYYSVRTIDSAGIAFRVLRRTSAGETFQEATASGSKFQLALSAILPEKQYIRCMVAEDSFSLLRGIMNLAAKKGIVVEWEPYKDEDGRIVFTPSQSGRTATPN